MRRSGLFAQPVALAPDGDDVTLVEQADEDRGCDDSVAEDGLPFADGAVRCDEHGTTLIAFADQLEEQMRGVGFERQIAEFIDDQQLRPGVVRQPLLETPLGLGLGQAGEQVAELGRENVRSSVYGLIRFMLHQ